MLDRCTNEFLEHVMSSSRVLDAIHGATESASERPARPSMAGRAAPQPMPTGHRRSAEPPPQCSGRAPDFSMSAVIMKLCSITYVVLGLHPHSTVPHSPTRAHRDRKEGGVGPRGAKR